MKRGRYFNRGRKPRPEDPHTGSRTEEGSSSEWGRDQDQGSSYGRGPRYESGGTGGSWTTAEPRRGRGGRGGRDRPPPGLRGKDIGLFYRNRTLERFKEQKGDTVGNEKPEFVMALRLPASVIKRVEKLLFTIFEKRKDELCLQGVFKCPENYMQKRDPFEEYTSSTKSSPCGSQTGDYDDPATKNTDLNSAKRYKPLPLRHDGQQYKYGYQDIITGSFMEKLDECLTKGITIQEKSSALDKLSEDYYNDYISKINTTKYKEMLKFRERLPAFKKRKELLDEINNNQVIVISGETGCGKSTQVPQIILDEAIRSKRGANVKIIVTQPRRIAASSLAARVSEERSENLGESVGYVVRLERKDARPRGSVTYCTTGVLLADLEVDQAVSGVSHIVLDEVHERDATVDLAMCMLKQVISKRKDLKLILMSATLDAESLSNYFDGCATMHIEGLAYPVTDVYMEEILQLTGYTLPPVDGKQGRHGRFNRKQTEEAEKDMQYKMEMGPLLHKYRSKLGEQVYKTLLDRRIEDLNVDLIFDLIRVICEKEPGAILVFVPGLADITKIVGMMEKSNEFPRHLFNIYPLHSKLPSLEQKRIFDRPPHGVRKIVVATNIAETSITIDDVVYVIDSAKIKVTGLSVADNINTLSVEWVSQANLRQRRGRAGRVQPGVCYHLVTSHRAARLPERLQPELQRSSLLEPVLTVKRLRLGRAAAALAAAPAPPAPDTLAAAVLHLRRLGALDENETLTPLGWHLARLPVHPAAGKLLLLGALFGCLDRAASVAACWGFKDPFVMVIGKEKEGDAAKSRLAIGEPSDHVAISEAIRQWETLGRGRSDFAWENFLSSSTLQLLCDMKRQFADNMKSMGFLPSGNIKSHWENRNADNLSIFKAVVAAALYPQIGTVRWVGMHRPNPRITVRTPEDGRVDIHPSSALSTPSYRRGGDGKRICSTPGANWHVYWLKQKTSKLFLFDLTLVHTMPLLFFGELNITDVEKEPSDCYINISSIKVRCNKTTAQLLVQLRNLLDEVLAARVAAPGALVQHGDFEENVLNAVIELITAEDEQTSYFEGDGDESDQSDSMVN